MQRSPDPGRAATASARVQALDARQFGVDTSCFVCDPRNDRGLRVPFFHDTEAQLVFCDFELPAEFSGAPTLVHGGATLALIDEGMAWATIAISGRFAFTRQTSARFDRPIRIGHHYRLEVRVAEADEHRIVTEAVVLDDRSKTRVTAHAVMAVLDLDQAAAAIGGPPTPAVTRHVP
ncbi:MAG: hotdog fold domain-containing protein [Acidimicrobiia bacterium]